MAKVLSQKLLENWLILSLERSVYEFMNHKQLPVFISKCIQYETRLCHWLSSFCFFMSYQFSLSQTTEQRASDFNLFLSRALLSLHKPSGLTPLPLKKALLIGWKVKLLLQSKSFLESWLPQRLLQRSFLLIITHFTNDSYYYAFKLWSTVICILFRFTCCRIFKRER